VQTPGAPTLSIQTLLNADVKVTWWPKRPGFALQVAGMMNSTPGAWTNAPAGYTNGAAIAASMQTRFFRLIKPQSEASRWGCQGIVGEKFIFLHAASVIGDADGGFGQEIGHKVA
jgi:hypothetical protein